MNALEQEFGFQDIVENAADGVLVTKASPLDDPGPEIVYVNSAMEDLSGYSRNELLGATPRMLQGPLTDASACRRIRRALQEKSQVRCRLLNYRKDGSQYWIEISIMPLLDKSGAVSHFAAIQRDISAYVKLEEHFSKAAGKDETTLLANKDHFLDGLDKEWRRAYRHHSLFSLLTFQVDQFNASHARDSEQSQQMLALIGATCKAVFRREDTLGRIGENEFAVLMPETDLRQAGLAAERLRSKLAALVDRHPSIRPPFTVSIGITQNQLLDERPESVLNRARQGLIKAGAQGDRVTIVEI
ncbi:sensor domain-containing diguanylate cyclase [Hahella sp. NBU794]|uniref:sensor domain-containing diguanylate cyclase n=1 Tax=Hahella sp. NBU794 TaxID=3422590 RepID=UPI003D6F4757